MAHDIEIAVGAGNCDAYVNFANTSMYLDAHYIYYGGFTGGAAMNAGFRFTGVTIPAGATIDTAHLQTYCYISTSGTTCNIRIKAEQGNNVAVFSTYADFNGRTKCATTVDWNNVGAQTVHTSYDTPDFKSIIQELVNDYGGLSNANIAIFLENNGSSASANRVCSAIEEGEPPAQLHIDYTEAASGFTSIQKIVEIAQASFQKIDEIAIASIEKINDIT